MDTSSLREFLQLPYPEARARTLALMQEDVFRTPLEIPRPEHRDRTLQAIQRIADEGIGLLAFPEEFGGQNRPGDAIAVFETLGLGDTSIMVKYGVQFGLWSGSLLQLGTRWHHERFLRDAATLALPGCYAMTEIHHGSNVRGLETTATYDPDAQEWVIHSPHEGAGKEWIGNAALHGRMAVVFAQLLVDGENHGVHALLVPIRNDAGQALPGIRIEDNGPKVGLNGVDNGRIWFDEVRVPREHLLDRFAQVTPEGEYQSPIRSSGRRFFTMLGTLVAGRISIAGGAVSAAKTGLAIATRYSARRRQFGPDDQPEIPILDFQVHQRLLLPRIARSYALHFGVRSITETYTDYLLSRQDSSEAAGDDLREIEAHGAGLKALATWHCADALQASREAMGGRGYAADNRIGQLRADTDIFATFEGANTVLLQLVAKSLLSHFKEEMGDLDFMGMVRYLAERAGKQITQLNPVATRRTDPDHLRDADFHQQAFRYREERLLASAVRRLKSRLDDGMEPFDAFNACQWHLEALGAAHTERFVLEAFHDAVRRAPTPGASEVLAELSQLYALSTIERHAGWFLETGYLEPPKSRAVRREVDALCRDLRDVAVDLVDAWGIPDAILGAPDAQAG